VDLDALRGVGQAIEVVEVVVPDVPLDAHGDLGRGEAHDGAVGAADRGCGDEGGGDASREDEDGRPRGHADGQAAHLRGTAGPGEDGPRGQTDREGRRPFLAGREGLERAEDAGEGGPVAAQGRGRSEEDRGPVGELLELAAEQALAPVHLGEPRGEGGASVGLPGPVFATRLHPSSEERDEGRRHEPRRHAMRHSSDGRPRSAKASTGGAASVRFFTNRAGRASSRRPLRSRRRKPRSAG
jgi:hypothetical protein